MLIVVVGNCVRGSGTEGEYPDTRAGPAIDECPACLSPLGNREADKKGNRRLSIEEVRLSHHYK